MREIIKLEQFYERIHPDLHSWLLDKNPKTLTEAAKLADENNAVRKTHRKTQKTQFQSHIPKTRPINGNTPVSAVVNKTYGSNTTDQPKTNTHETSAATLRNHDKYRRMIWHYCHKKGHIRSQCYALKRAEVCKQETDPSVVQHLVLKTNELDNTNNKKLIQLKLIRCLTLIGALLHLQVQIRHSEILMC